MIRNNLCCPKCKGNLNFRNKIVCSKCRSSYLQKNGIPILTVSKIKTIDKDSLRFKVLSSEFFYKLIKTLFYSSSYLRRNYAKVLVNNAKSKDFILDIGSGTTRLNEHTVNLDIFPYPNVDIVGDIYQLPIKSKSCDLIILKTVLEHLPNVHDALTEVDRVLSKNGLLYVEVPFIFHYHSSPDDYYRWTHSGLKEQFKNYKIIKEGIVYGPAASFVMAISHFFAILLSFGNSSLYTILSLIFTAILKPLSLFDFILNRFPTAVNFSAAFFIVAQKKGR